ncbi:hypothetical protein ACR80S_08420 [Halomonas sp. MA07-2]
MTTTPQPGLLDLFVIGGGINGAGIASDYLAATGAAPTGDAATTSA